MAVKKGDTIQIHYKGTLDDGSVFDSSEGRDPLEFEVGSGMVIPGFDEGVMGMEEGQEKDIDIPAEKAYGEYKDDLVKDVPKDQLPPEAQAGSQLMMSLPNGAQMPVTVKEIKDDKAFLDLNHPLAGKNLHFHITLVKIKTKE